MDCLRRHFDPMELRVLMLIYVAGWSRARVAEELGVSLKRLKKLLDGHEERVALRGRVKPHLRALADGRLCETYEAALPSGLQRPHGWPYLARERSEGYECPSGSRVWCV